MNILLIPKAIQRRFILGQQGLWPGRRWQGKAGVTAALGAGAVIQIDPLNSIARSHDIALQSRVINYQPNMLDELVYTDRIAFDYGGTVFIHPMEQLPYWRVVMERNSRRARWAAFAEQHPRAIDEVRAEIRVRGPLAGRDFKGNKVGPGNYRGTKDTGLALYMLWFSGELMTAGRRFGGGQAGAPGGSFDRLYDLRERVAPAHLQWSASTDEADAFFALEVFRKMGMADALSFKNWFSGLIGRPVGAEEAAERLAALQAQGSLLAVQVEGAAYNPHYLLTSEGNPLEDLLSGRTPADWRPLETCTDQEMVVLAPLEIVSARGRAKPLFGFDYIWEVYKPVELRRWGYYTLPLLYGDRLAARIDSRLDRATRTLHLLGFWLEDWVILDEPFRAALSAGLRRFLNFLGASRLACASGVQSDALSACQDIFE